MTIKPIRIQPSLNDLLPTEELLLAYDRACDDLQVQQKGLGGQSGVENALNEWSEIPERPVQVQPGLDELLPSPGLLQAYDAASAALEAGHMIRAMRKRAKLSQRDLGSLLEMSQARVSAIEAGEGRDGPTYGLIRRIAVACGSSGVAVLAEMAAAHTLSVGTSSATFSGSLHRSSMPHKRKLLEG